MVRSKSLREDLFLKKEVIESVLEIEKEVLLLIEMELFDEFGKVIFLIMKIV